MGQSFGLLAVSIFALGSQVAPCCKRVHVESVIVESGLIPGRQRAVVPTGCVRLMAISLWKLEMAAEMEYQAVNGLGHDGIGVSGFR